MKREKWDMANQDIIVGISNNKERNIKDCDEFDPNSTNTGIIKT